MHIWNEGDIVANGTQLHYYRTGGAKPPIVLAHGITDDGLCWTPVAEALAGPYDVVMVDLRGHGKSKAPESGYDLATMAADVAGLISGLGLENPVVMGHSLGAVITLTLASLNPNLMRAIILEDPPPFWNMDSHSPEGEASRAVMRTRIEAQKRKTRDDLLREGRMEHPDWPDAEWNPWVDSKHRFSLRITQILDTADSVPADFLKLTSQIICPALLIMADPERGAASTKDDAARLRTSVPHLEIVHIPDSGHSIRREQFSRYMDAVQSFLGGLAG